MHKRAFQVKIAPTRHKFGKRKASVGMHTGPPREQEHVGGAAAGHWGEEQITDTLTGLSHLSLGTIDILD